MTTSQSRGSVGARAAGSGRPRNPNTENSGAEAIRDFVDDMREALEQSGIDAGSLILEITESAMLYDSERALRVIRMNWRR